MHTCIFSQLRMGIKNKPFVILSEGAEVPWHGVRFVNVVQFTFKHCNFIFFSPL